MVNPETVFRNEKFAVERVPVERRDGGVMHKERIVHPGAAVILPLLDDGRIVLIRNERFAIGQTLLELPAGTLDPGEAPMTAAGRELVEETGYRAGALNKLVSFYSTPGFCTEVMHAFVATDLTLVGQTLQPTERIEPAPHTVAEVDQLIANEAVQDGKTLATYLFWRRSIEGASPTEG